MGAVNSLPSCRDGTSILVQGFDCVGERLVSVLSSFNEPPRKPCRVTDLKRSVDSVSNAEGVYRCDRPFSRDHLVPCVKKSIPLAIVPARLALALEFTHDVLFSGQRFCCP